MIDYDKFREEREDLDFKIGGEEFHIQMMPMNVVGVWTEREEKADAGVPFLNTLIDRIADAVDDGSDSRERWLGFANGPNGPSYGEILDIGQKVWAAQTAVPTKRPEHSPTGPGDTGTSPKGE